MLTILLACDRMFYRHPADVTRPVYRAKNDPGRQVDRGAGRMVDEVIPAGFAFPLASRVRFVTHASFAKLDQKEADWSQLMARAQDGDQPAYEMLLRAVIPHIRASARRSGAPPDRVDDVVQDVLMTIHRVRQTYDPARPFGPWLQAIIQRRTIDGQRRWGRQRLREVHAPLLSDMQADPAPSPIEGIERAAQRRRVERAVEDLPPGQREAVRLLALDEQSLSEAASLTGRTTGALKVNLHRALKALKARLGGTDKIEENQ